jgi:hypothetical protein
MVGLILTLLVLPVGQADASPFKACGTFGSSGEGVGQFAGTSPESLAVDNSTGTVYAYDNGPNRRVEIFTPAANCKVSTVNSLTGSETPAGSFSEEGLGLAVDNSGGPSKRDLYVSDTSNGVVDKFTPAGAYVGQLGVPLPAGVAVDAEGNVYVAGLLGEVVEFDGTGAEVRRFSGGLLQSGLLGIAIDSHGNLDVLEETRIVKLNLNAGKVVHESILDEHEPRAVSTGPNGFVYAVDHEGEPHVSIYNQQGGLIEQFGLEGLRGTLAVAARETGGSRLVYAAAAITNEVAVFEQKEVPPLVEPPEFIVCGASSLTRTGAKLECTIRANAATASWHVLYGPVGGPLAELPGGTLSGTETVGKTVTGLTVGSEYMFKMIATNTHGESEGEATFSTFPAVAGLTACQAIEVEGVHATLGASLEPEGLLTHYHFEYGLTTAYGASTTEGSTEAEASTEVQAETAELEGNASYHCRLTADNSFGDTSGEDGTFTTPPVAPLVDVAPPSAAVTRTAALLRGTLNPENSPTEFRFQWVEAGAYEPGAPNPYRQGGETPAVAVPAGFGATGVGPQLITGLKPGTEYHYRLVAEDQATQPGEPATGADHTFTTAAATAPQVTAEAASEVGVTTATAAFQVQTSGLATTYRLELGSEGRFEGPVLSGSAGESNEPISIGLHLAGLAPGASYQYRVTTANADGSETSSVISFTTLGYPVPVLSPPPPQLLGFPPLVFPPPTSPSHRLTAAQRLAKALTQCRRDHKPAKRRSCERAARRKYPVKKRK